MTKLSSFHNYKIRNGLLHISKHRTAKIEVSAIYQSIKLYDHLPCSDRNFNHNEFKRNGESLLLKNCYYKLIIVQNQDYFVMSTYPMHIYTSPKGSMNELCHIRFQVEKK